MLTLPIFVPIITQLGYDPIWFGVLFAINMQVSFLSPPFGPAAFYLKGVAPPEITLGDIFASLWPFILMQLTVLAIMLSFRTSCCGWSTSIKKQNRSGGHEDRASRRINSLNFPKADVDMKITNIKTWLVPPRWMFVKIETDEGVSGWGEPVIEGRARTVQAAVEEMAEILIGRDPRHIQDIWQMLYRTGFLPWRSDPNVCHCRY